MRKYLNYFSQQDKLLYYKVAWTRMSKNLVEDNIKITYNEKKYSL